MTPIRALLAAFLALALLVAPGGLTAQTAATTTPEVTEETRPDYQVWDQVAARAERALEAGRASNQALESLRSEVVTWRDRFAAARSENQVRIDTLKIQIASLGPPPEEGGTEPAVITTRRAELQAQLEELQAPVKAAELAHARAGALIAAVDRTLRGRQTDALLALGPTPLNPTLWPKAAEDILLTLRLSWRGVLSTFSTETQRASLRQNLPLALLTLLLAVVLLARGRTWVMRMRARVSARWHGPAHGVWDFLLSLGQVAAPLIGVYLLVEALHLAGVLGLRAQVIAEQLPLLGVAFFLARWLGNRLFGQPGDGLGAVLNLPPGTRSEGRFEVTALGLMYGIALLLGSVADYESYSEASRAVITFPVVVFTGFLLFRLGQLLRSHTRAEAKDAEDGAGFMARTLGLAGLALILLGVFGPLAAAVGYARLADSFVFPTVLTAGMVGGLLVLHQFFINLHGMIFKVTDDQAREALIPVLASLVVTVLVVPVFALIWGARVTDLTEIWRRIGEGVTLGETVISPGDILTFALVFGIGFVATRLVQGTLKTTVLPKTKIDVGGQTAIVSGLGYVGIFLAALFAITSAGIDLSSLAIVAGALSVGIGFGLQNIVSNFVSGIILLIERPISEGDWIEVGGQMGWVRDISVRSTRIETFDRTDVILPNSDLISGIVTNYTRGNLTGRVIVPVGVAYGTDTRRVEAVLRDVATAHPLVAMTPPPAVLFSGFGADSLDFEIRAILRDVNFVLSVRSDLNHEIARRFAEEGIEIPFAQRDIWLRNPEVLAAGAAAPKPPKKAKAGRKAAETDPERAAAHLDEAEISEAFGTDEGDD
jgi:potassium-dependent mechanosensitive channel